MSIKTIRIELARGPGHPEGDPGHAYEFRAPLDTFRYLDKTAWPRVKPFCTVHRFEDGFEVERGLLILTGKGHWAFSYAPGSEDDEGLFKLGTHRIVPDEYITVTEHDGEARTFRITSVSDWHAAPVAHSAAL